MYKCKTTFYITVVLSKIGSLTTSSMEFVMYLAGFFNINTEVIYDLFVLT